MKPTELLSMMFSGDAPQERLAEELMALDRVHVRIAVIGRSGTGKSSLINTLYGERVAQTGAVETTEAPEEFELDGLIVVDFPGCGTARFPRETYVEDMNLAKYDAFVLVVAKRVMEDDLFLMKAIRERLKKDVHVVRSMVDQDVDNATRDGRSSAQVLSQMRADLAHQFPGHPWRWLVSSVRPDQFDFPDFEDSLRGQLEGHKHDKFVFAAQAYTERQLAEKRKVAEKRVMIHAGLAAANGFNPLVGANVLADLAIINKMNDWILRCYKLDEAHVRALLGLHPNQTEIEALLKQVLTLGTKKFVMAALRAQAKRVTGKELARWVPILGGAASAGMGFAVVHRMGNALIDKCETTVRDLIASRLRG